MIRAEINNQLKRAMLNKDKEYTSTLRLILAAIKDREIIERAKNKSVEDDVIIEVLSKMVKQRIESADIYKKNERLELAKKEEYEISVIRNFMPTQLSDDEVKTIIGKIIRDNNASSIKDMGVVMAELKKEYSGQLDFGAAGKMIKDILSN
ncbi:MAG: glutamyl-tRNA amidotransferase [Rhodobiaceae bacterium]|nr:glutamyl-tRNA amidotransferase [Rhodobiaceae bacterium]RPF96937.1 MAG: GatB/YqeY domain-containing protein [Rhizobiales bacterium TMED227]|tara:strand:- start:3308 stop:3760 length:453 start_codon:yes stop_codon:yes gene_type:complete